MRHLAIPTSTMCSVIASPTTRLLLATASCLSLFLAACGSTSNDPAVPVDKPVGVQIEAPRVTLVDAGSAPHTTLRYRDIDTGDHKVNVTVTDAFTPTVGTAADTSDTPELDPQSPTTFTSAARPDYAGPSWATVVVPHGKDLNDSSGKTAWLTLPITVTPGDNRPPTIAPTAVEVAPGETTTVDVSLWTTDPDGEKPADLTYSVRDVPAGVEASISGKTLSVAAPSGASKGSLGSLTIDVKDGSGAQGSGSAPVSIVSSSQPLIMLSPASVSANAGQSTTVDISSYAVNPFPDSPIHLVGTPAAPDGITV